MDGIPAATRQDLIQIMATEHFTLQGARSAAISDANGRTNFFLGSLSSVVVGLALISQVTELGAGFRIFALVLLPSILFVGLVSFERLLQLGIENIRCVIAINRIRHYYMEVAPELQPHFTLSPHDDPRGVLLSLGALHREVRWWDIAVTNAGTVAVLDGILAGVIAAVVAWQFEAAAAVAIGAGLALGALVAGILLAYAARSWLRARSDMASRFPSDQPIEPLHAPATAEPTAAVGRER